MSERYTLNGRGVGGRERHSPAEPLGGTAKPLRDPTECPQSPRSDLASNYRESALGARRRHGNGRTRADNLAQPRPVSYAQNRQAVNRRPEPFDISSFSLDLMRDGQKLERGEPNRSLGALKRRGCMEATGGRRMRGSVFNRIKNVGAEAPQVVGMWPFPESAADRLLLAANDNAESSSDPVEKAV